MRIESIETAYNGITYRSRTEARWAMLFDKSSLRFQYEPEGYELYSGRYVPDFLIYDWDCFFEVKPGDVIIEAGYYCDERSKAEDLAMALEKNVIFGCGSPHLQLQLSIVPPLGISPIREHILERFKASAVMEVASHRFDWRYLYKPNGGPIGDWQHARDIAPSAYADLTKGWRDE